MACSGKCVWMFSKILGVPPECAGVLVVGMGTVFFTKPSQSDQIWSNPVKI